MTGRIRHVAVVVPANDEERSIEACLDAIDVARRSLLMARPEVSVEVVVVLDACVDGTQRLVTRRGGARVVRVADRCVGAARRAGSAGLAPDAGTWFANTDADSTVPPHWLTAQVCLADAGAELVLGTVTPDGDPDAVGVARWRTGYRQADGHRHVHGANLGVRADVLHALGGWPPLVTGEDVALARRARRAGVAITRTGAIPVRTSARVVGRAPAGFAGFLARLE